MALLGALCWLIQWNPCLFLQSPAAPALPALTDRRSGGPSGLQTCTRSPEWDFSPDLISGWAHTIVQCFHLWLSQLYILCSLVVSKLPPICFLEIGIYVCFRAWKGSPIFVNIPTLGYCCHVHLNNSGRRIHISYVSKSWLPEVSKKAQDDNDRSVTMLLTQMQYISSILSL